MTLGWWPKRWVRTETIRAERSRHLGLWGGEVAALPVDDRAAGFVDAEDLGIFLGEPGGRSVGGGTHDDLEAIGGGEVDGALEPRGVVLSFVGLDGASCVFADADDVHAGGAHELKISGPARFGPLLRIPSVSKIGDVVSISRPVSGRIERIWPTPGTTASQVSEASRARVSQMAGQLASSRVPQDLGGLGRLPASAWANRLRARSVGRERRG